MLIPFTGETPTVTTVAQKTDGQRPASLTLTWADGTVDELTWTYRGIIMLGAVGEYETDGGMLYLRKDAAGNITAGCAVEATYLTPITNRIKALPAMIKF